MGFGVSKCICAEVGSDKEALDGSEQKRSKFGFSPHKKHHTPSMSKVERGGCLLTISLSLSLSLSLSNATSFVIPWCAIDVSTPRFFFPKCYIPNSYSLILLRIVSYSYLITTITSLHSPLYLHHTIHMLHSSLISLHFTLMFHLAWSLYPILDSLPNSNRPFTPHHPP